MFIRALHHVVRHRAGLTLLVLLGFASVASAQTVTLAWDPNPEPDIAGYRVEFGTTSGNPSTTVDVGNVTTRQFTGLQIGVTYYFRVRAYNTSGMVSDPSNEVSHTPQGTPVVLTLSSVSPSSGPTSGGTVITLTGTNFASGATVRVGGNLATGVTFVSSSQLRATTPAGTAGARSVQVTNPGGQSASLSNAFTYVAPPTVTGVSPSSGPTSGGTVITITGTNFVSGATVRVGGVAATGVTFLSSTQLRATTPAGSAGARSVQVINPGGQSATRSNAFTYVAAPTVTSVSPSSGPTGGGTVITVNGTNFVSGATVRVGGAAATGVTFLSSTQLRATTPAGTAGARSVQVTNPDGQSATRSNAFTYVLPAPSITSVTPSSGPTTGGTVITISGANFVSGATVRVGSVAATGVTFLSSTQLRATTPAGSAGARSVQVTNPGGQSATRSNAFTYVAPAPTVTAVTPNSGPTGGGTVITVSGTNFVSGATVRVGGVAATGVTFLSSTQLRATTPAGSAGSRSVQVTNPDGQSATLANAFTYTQSSTSPTLTAVSPTSGPAGGGTRITLTGTNFAPGAMVRVGGAPATGVTFVSSTTLTATTPAGSAGPRAVQVINPDAQSASLANGFTYVGGTADDSDGDGLPNEWETRFGLDAQSAVGDNGASGDPDGDSATNLAEYEAGTHPRGFFQRYLAEGVANAFFNTRFAIANPHAAEAKVLLTFADSEGRTSRHYVAVPARGRRTIEANAIADLAGASFSTALDSDRVVVIDRLMSWAGSAYAAHAETAVAQPATSWFLAEGATHGNFELFYLILNPSSTAANVRIRYLRPSGAPIVKTYTVGPGSRFTIWVDQEDPQLAATDVSAEITSTNGVPIIVERSMYLNTTRAFKGGHNSTGVTAPATSWFLAEGSTGGFFSTFVLLANPTSRDASVEATYMRATGAPIVKRHTVRANSRLTINVALEDPALADAAVSAKIVSTNGVPIIVERTMWWVGRSGAWTEGHNAFGTTTTGPRWLLAEGELGGPNAVSTFVLIANTSSEAARVRVTVLFESGAEQSVTYTIAANQRFTVPIVSAFPKADGKRFSVLVESLNPEQAGALVVERAMYWNTDEEIWGAGSNAVATKLP